MNLHSTFKIMLLCFFSSSILFTTSCKKDDILARDKFMGIYNVNERCESDNFNYSISIIESANSEDGIIIGNFGDLMNVKAIVSGDNIIFNDIQDGITFSGSGNINGNTLTIIYTTSGALTDSCTKVCIKQ